MVELCSMPYVCVERCGWIDVDVERGCMRDVVLLILHVLIVAPARIDLYLRDRGGDTDL